MNCIPEGKQLINLTSKAKTPLSCWKARGGEMPGFNMSESEVVFRFIIYLLPSGVLSHKPSACF